MDNAHGELFREAARLLDGLERGARPWVQDVSDLQELPELSAILEGRAELQIAVVREMAERLSDLRNRLAEGGNTPYQMLNLRHHSEFPHATALVGGRLLRRRLPWRDEDLETIALRIADLEYASIFALPFLPALVTTIEKHMTEKKRPAGLARAARMLSDALAFVGRAAENKLRARLEGLEDKPRQLPLQPGEAWSDAVLAEQNIADEKRATWAELFTHAATAKAAKPSGKWRKVADEFMRVISWNAFRDRVVAWFPLVDRPRTRPVELDRNWLCDPNLMICDLNGNILKGLVWCCAEREDKDLARTLTALAISCYKKVPGIGPRLTRVGNACVWALGEMPGMEGIGQLALLRIRVKFGSAQQAIDKALTAAAKRVGLPRDELDEMAVPAYGLEVGGIRREQLGEFTAELVVTGTGTTDLSWLRSDGKRQKSVPATVKASHGEDLQELKRAAKDIQKMLPAQRERIDQLYHQRRTWTPSVWRERYIDHPLIGTIARRLIWNVRAGDTRRSIFYDDGKLVSADGEDAPPPPADSNVELWHPLHADLDEILAWRALLESREIRQPFKQAHREVYLLTDAERQTDVYSNRFAAHVLRQHQFNALCAARGWVNKLRLLVDDEYPPAYRMLPAWGLRAEFWIEGLGQEYDVDTNESGVFLYVGTDQVRFYQIDAARSMAHAGGGGYYSDRAAEAAEPVGLHSIPELVLSEIMRDVDLFVGVASVGNDPTWSDGGVQGRYREYWGSYAFGALSETAQTRRTVLERVIPRLKIGGQCSVGERFLIVRGSLRTYKIHLGSGNILMEPNDAYLCVVPKQSVARRGSDVVYLPFDGDRMLSIILSKALLLADDQAITDRTILRQIQHT